MTGREYSAYLDTLVAEASNVTRFKVKSGAEFLGDDSIPEDPFELPAVVEHISVKPEQAADALEDTGIRIIEAGEFAGGEYVEPDWLIEELIPARGIGLAWGLSGSDKTGGVFDLMAATHCTGVWRDKAVKRGRSVMVVGEGEYFFANRMRAYAADRGIDISEMPAIVPHAIDLRNGKQVKAFAREAEELGCAQVWFDSLQQCTPGADENSVKDMGQVITHLKFLAREVGCFAGAIHHAGKDVEKGARGSSAWRPAVDVELYFESNGTSGTMSVFKLKDGPPNSVYPFERRVLSMTRNGKSTTSVVVVQSDANRLALAKCRLPKRETEARKAYDIAATEIRPTGEAAEDDVIAKIAATKKEPAPGETDRRVSRATSEVKKLVLQGHLLRVGKMLRTSAIVKGTPDENC